ncbi:hypothetical protein [Ramlibacter rhizophilus]|uniref:Uncharacterized protein n=1 Tax=Ramlibacter rhizophilus TaxID=1781167 RepID=A0A4Z0BS72_9BURK|nr:hypothetical protein [Ramlibacter rhizophilus]TFZ01314.1 hypothetical protein EZ242_07995 [Ramlibacter rhizophilus]
MAEVSSPRRPSLAPLQLEGKPIMEAEPVVFHVPVQDAVDVAPTALPMQVAPLTRAPQPSPDSTASPTVQSMEDPPDPETFARHSAEALAQAVAAPEEARPGALLACLDRWCVTPVCCGDRELACCCCVLLTVGAVVGAVLGEGGAY